MQRPLRWLIVEATMSVVCVPVRHVSDKIGFSSVGNSSGGEGVIYYRRNTTNWLQTKA